MGERSAAFGGLLIIVTIVWALAYSLGESQQLMSWGLDLIRHTGMMAVHFGHWVRARLQSVL